MALTYVWLFLGQELLVTFHLKLQICKLLKITVTTNLTIIYQKDCIDIIYTLMLYLVAASDLNYLGFFTKKRFSDGGNKNFISNWKFSFIANNITTNLIKAK